MTRAALRKLNLPRYICHHLLGKRHSHGHRISVGVLIMILGVWVSKMVHDPFVLHFFCDVVGYGLHGMGAIPVFDWATEKAEETQG